jgi:hypothetical protein
MKIEVNGFLELSTPLVEIIEDMKIDPVNFFVERLNEAIDKIEERIANELQIMSPCLTSDLTLDIVEDL